MVKNNDKKSCYKCGGDHHYSTCPDDADKPTYSTRSSNTSASPGFKVGNTNIPAGHARNDGLRKGIIVAGLLGFTALILTQCFNDQSPPAPQEDLSAKYPSIALASLHGSYLVGVGKDKDAAEAARKAIANCRVQTDTPKCSVRVNTEPRKPTCVVYSTIPTLDRFGAHIGHRFLSSVTTTQTRPSSQDSKDSLCQHEKGNDLKMCRGRVEVACNF